MTVIRDASTMFASFFSLVLFLILFESRYSRKKTLTLTISLMGPLMAANFILLAVLGPVVMSTLLLLTCSLPSLIFFWFLARHRDGRYFFTFSFTDTIMLEVIYLTSILDFYLGDTYIFMVAARLLLCPALSFAFVKWVRPTYKNLQNNVSKGWYTFTAIALIYYVTMSLAVSVPCHITQRPEQIPAFILLLIQLPFLYIHIFTTLHHQVKAHETAEQDKILSLQVSSLISRLEDFRTSNDLLQQERHDFRHKIRTIAALAENKDLEAINQAVTEYAETIPESIPHYYCDHKILDAVLASYLGYAKRKGIQVSAKLLLPEILPVNETDLATALANTLENAIHACEKIEQPNRYIEVKSITHPCFMLQVKNSFDGIVAFDEEGIPLAAKKGHGFGTRSIATFCNKNNAFYEFSAEENDFITRMIFNH